MVVCLVQRLLDELSSLTLEHSLAALDHSLFIWNTFCRVYKRNATYKDLRSLLTHGILHVHDSPFSSYDLDRSVIFELFHKMGKLKVYQ